MSPRYDFVGLGVKRRCTVATMRYRGAPRLNCRGGRHRDESLTKRWAVVFLIAIVALGRSSDAQDRGTEKRLEAVRSIITAVNARDADFYVANFAEDAIVRLYEGEVRVRGRQAMRENRTRHFERYPHARNELLHLVAIDDRVIMHDRVWLDRRDGQPSDVVEIFTFDGNDRIVLVDVIQPRDAFTRGARPAQN